MAAFDMEILAYDPYVTSARAHQLGAQLVELDDLLAKSDVVTIHMPKTLRPSACSAETPSRP